MARILILQRWQSLFGVRFDPHLYAPTSTYFEGVPPEEGQRQFGYGRDPRLDCVQGGIALIFTPDGWPLAYAVMTRNPSDKTTLAEARASVQVKRLVEFGE